MTDGYLIFNVRTNWGACHAVDFGVCRWPTCDTALVFQSTTLMLWLLVSAMYTS